MAPSQNSSVISRPLWTMGSIYIAASMLFWTYVHLTSSNGEVHHVSHSTLWDHGDHSAWGSVPLTLRTNLGKDSFTEGGPRRQILSFDGEKSSSSNGDSEETPTILQCGSQVTLDGTTSVVSFHSGDINQKLHLTTCGEGTNVDTSLTAFVNTIKSDVIAFNDDDDWCPGTPGASTITIDSVRGSTMLFTVGFKGATAPSDAKYELFLMCEDLPPSPEESLSIIEETMPSIPDVAQSPTTEFVESVQANLHLDPLDYDEDAEFFMEPEVWSKRLDELEAEIAQAKQSRHVRSLMEIEIMNVRELSDFHTGYAYTPVSDEGDVYPSSEQTTSYDTYPWHSLDEYSGNQTVTQTCRPLPDFGCNETMFGIATYNATEKAEVLPLYAFNISTEQYGQQLDFTLCTEEIVGFSGYLAMYGSCASGSNDTFFGVPVNASETDGFCASGGRVLDVSVTRATGFNGLQFVISGGASGMASPYNELTLISGETYVFNQSGPTNHGYELAFSLNSEGTWDTNNGTEYDFEANGGELAYFVDNVKVNRSTYQKYIGTVHGAEWLDTYSSSAVSRLIRVVVPDSLPDAISAVNIANGRDGKASLFYFSPNRKTMGGQLFIIGDEEMVTKSTFYFAGAPRFVFGLEGNSTYLPMEQGDSIEYAIRFECGSTPPVAATPSPTPIPTSEPTVEACVFEPFTCFDLFEGTTSEWPVGSEADAATTISQFSIPPSYFNTTLSFSSCILADLDVPEGVYWSLTETCSDGTTSARPDGRPIHRQHYSAGKLAEEAEYMVFGAVNDGNMSECFRHDGYAVDGFDDYAVVNTTMSFFFDVDEIPTFSLGLAALTNVNLTEALSFEVVTSCPSEPAECPYVDLSCGDTVYDMIDLNDAGEFRHKATYRLVLDDAVAGDLVTVSTCNPATTFDSFLSLLDDCPQRTTGATEYDLPVSVLGTNNDVEGTCPANELASELSFYYDDYAASSAGLAGNSSYYVLLEPFGNLANGANGSYALTVTCGVTPSPTPAPTTFVEDSCSYTETSCGEILMTSLEVFSSDVTESSTSHTTNTTETTVEVTETGVNSTSVAMEYEIVAAAPNWLREDITVQEVFDIEGSFECSVKSTTETVVNKVTEVTVTETLTTTYGTTGVELFTLNVTGALLWLMNG